jgi:predicted acetyltransferase
MTTIATEASCADGGPRSSGFAVRALTTQDWPAAKAVDGLAFGYQPDDDFLDTVALPTYEISRFTGVFDTDLGDQLVGIGAIQSRNMTLPGQRPTPVAAVTWVAVRPDQQRRGILRQVMTHQLHGLHQSAGESVAILTASEGGIYGRFGYGNAESRVRLTVPAPAEFKPGVEVQRVRQVLRDEAMSAIKLRYAAAQSTTTGFLSRSDADWAARFSDHPKAARGRTPFRYVLHADGYAVYHLVEGWNDAGPDQTLELDEICATTPLAWASIWNFLLRHPLTRTVKYRMGWADDPLPLLLANPRGMTQEHTDHVWVRLVDLQRAMPLRSYSSAVSVVIRIADEFCPWNAGVWRLELDGDGGTAPPPAAPPAIEADITDLGSAFLGGTRIARLASAGRVTGSPEAVLALDSAFAGPLHPWTPEGF